MTTNWLTAGEWVRVTKARPCPICSHRDWCTVSADGSVAKCMRSLQGAFRVVEDGSGYAAYHKLTDPIDTSGAARAAAPTLSPERCRLLARRWHDSISTSRRDSLAAKLGVSVESLTRLRLGWVSATELETLHTKCSGAGCYTFPMRDAGGAIVGIRLRSPDGFKYAVAGSSQGLFYAVPWTTGGALWIVEGPTDLAAAMDLGLKAIGRPSNTALTDSIVAHARQRCVRGVVIVPDSDPKGSDAERNTTLGIERLRDAFGRVRVPVKVLVPPAKDLRAWINSGATRTHVLALAGVTPKEAQHA